MTRRSVAWSFIAVLLFLPMTPMRDGLGSAHADEELPWYENGRYTIIDKDTDWSGHITRETIPKPVVIVGGKTLTIAAGTRVEIDRIVVTDGRIIAKGTENEKIVFTKQESDFSWMTPDFEQYDRECFLSSYPDGTIEFSDSVETAEEASSVFRHVVFDGMGTHISNNGENCPDVTMRERSFRSLFVNTAHAAEPIMRTSPALLFRSGQLHIENSVFKNGNYTDIETGMYFGDEWESYDSLHIVNSNFEGNDQHLALASTFEYDGEHAKDYSHHVLLKNNWYGNSSGPTASENPTGTGTRLLGTYFLDGWSTAEHGASVICADCPSNVFFLPGLKASKLYKEESPEDENRLWPPNFFGNDLDDLALNSDGESVESVYTRDVLEEVGVPVIGGNIYKSFLTDLEELKTAGTIIDYQTFAYDWRQNVEDIAKNGTPYAPAAVRSAVADLESLAASSKTGKATIIAHSNGGLLAKAIMLELEASGKSTLVDKIVFVGTPQMGTPIAVLSLLYGYEESALFGTLISHEDARELAENMPGAYGLLPSSTYFDRMEDPFVTFTSERTRYKEFKDAYDEEEGIGDVDELGSFLSGEGDGRSEPDADDVEIENTLRENLLRQASEMHDRLDAWTPPTDVEVIQIAGWGIDTVSGVEYTEKERATCHSAGASAVPSCTGLDEYDPVYEPKFTVDGDKTVVAPSALMLSEAENVSRYWVNLFENNKGLSIDREHKDLFEVDSVQEFLSDTITKMETDLPEFMKDFRPNSHENASERIRMSLYSPLDIHIYDAHGNHTGPKDVEVDGHTVTILEEGIPNSYYYRFGDRKYVGFGSGEPVRVEMDGYDSGSYTLKLEEVRPTDTGETVVAHTTFEHLPVSPSTEVFLDIPASGITELPALDADFNGGTAGGEYVVEPVLGGTATLVTDVIAPGTTASLSGPEGANGWYLGDVTVTLFATDNENGDGVEKTEYSSDGGLTWQIYVEPTVFSSEGTTTLLYRSSDKAGNVEEEKTVGIKIDRTAPEARILFDSGAQKLDIRGIDNLPGDVPVSISESVILIKTGGPRVHSWSYWLMNRLPKQEKKTIITATLTDQAGHVTGLAFEESRDRDRRIDLALTSVSYDGAKSDIRHVSFQYKWLFDRFSKKYTLLASHLRDDRNTLESWYRPKRGETWIMEWSRELDDRDDDREVDRRPVRKKLSGLVVPYLETEKGDVKIGY